MGTPRTQFWPNWTPFCLTMRYCILLPFQNEVEAGGNRQPGPRRELACRPGFIGRCEFLEVREQVRPCHYSRRAFLVAVLDRHVHAVVGRAERGLLFASGNGLVR